MPCTREQPLLDTLLDSWDRNNAFLVNLLRLVPQGGLEARAMPGSPSVLELLAQMHFVRLVFLSESTPDVTVDLPGEAWIHEPDTERIAQMLKESAKTVRDVVRTRLEDGRAMKLHYDNPILFLQHMIWHEGYHHGQTKVALKKAGLAISDEAASPGTWGVWMRKST